MLIVLIGLEKLSFLTGTVLLFPSLVFMGLWSDSGILWLGWRIVNAVQLTHFIAVRSRYCWLSVSDWSGSWAQLCWL